MAFDSVFYKGTQKSLFMLEIVPSMHMVHMGGEFILHVVHISGMRITESSIDGLSRGNNMVGMKRGLNPLNFVLLDKGVVEISTVTKP